MTLDLHEPILDGGEMGFWRSSRLVVALVLAFGGAGCVVQNRPAVRGFASDVTGSCEGACEHYTECKGIESPSMDDACVVECKDIYEDPFTLAHFESLECVDAIAFVEGASGRGPGGQIVARPN